MFWVSGLHVHAFIDQCSRFERAINCIAVLSTLCGTNQCSTSTFAGIVYRSRLMKMIFGRLLRPHPRVLGTSVCVSTRCFHAGLSSGFPARGNCCVFFLQERLFFSLLFFVPIQLIALINNTLLSVDVRRAICRWCRASVIRSRGRVCRSLAARTRSVDCALQFRFRGKGRGTAADQEWSGRVPCPVRLAG